MSHGKQPVLTLALHRAGRCNLIHRTALHPLGLSYILLLCSILPLFMFMQLFNFVNIFYCHTLMNVFQSCVVLCKWCFCICLYCFCICLYCLCSVKSHLSNLTTRPPLDRHLAYRIVLLSLSSLPFIFSCLLDILAYVFHLHI